MFFFTSFLDFKIYKKKKKKKILTLNQESFHKWKTILNHSGNNLLYYCLKNFISLLQKKIDIYKKETNFFAEKVRKKYF